MGLILLVGTLACYWPVGHFNFLNYDDDRYVSGNTMVSQGLSWGGVRWAFGSLECCNWHPLTWLSHSLDCQLYGLDAGAHHATNLVFHAANVLLLFGMLRRMTGAAWRSAFVAALFGWHPMHVESVAWVAERKDMLSAFFGLLSLWAYARYAQQSGTSNQWSVISNRASATAATSKVLRTVSNGSLITDHRLLFYLLSLGCFALGLMSKPMLVTLPFVMLLLDFWPLRRPGLKTQDFRLKTLLPLLREKVPFFALSAASCVITYIAQSRGGAVAPVREVSGVLRVENVLVSYASYLLKLFWPARLAVFYPLPASFPLWEVAVAGLALVMVTALVIWQAGSRPWLAVGWFWFLGTLVPVIGLVQVGDQALADRYTYMPYIGVSIALVWSALELPGLNRRRKLVLAGLGSLGLAACLVQTRFDLQFWHDSQRLFERTLAVAGESFLAHSRLASALMEQGQAEEAERHYRRALEFVPGSGLAHNDLGVALAGAGKSREAEAQLREAIRLDPRLGSAYNNLGKLLTEERRLDEAAAILQAALKLDPTNEPAHCKLGFVWAQEGDLQKAADEFAAAARLAPQDADVQNMLARLLLQTGGAGKALDHFLAEAKARPGDALPLSVLARLYLEQNQPREAVAALNAAIALAPRTPSYLNQLARVYATHPSAEIRNGPETVRLAERACRLSGRPAAFVDTLSAAYAEAGRFADAVRAAEEARDKALASQDEKTAQSAARRLEQYRGRR
jgi:tetratricopeptide (TPR) repeat protein